MRSRMLGSILVMYHALALPSCSTDVDVGDNARIARERKAKHPGNRPVTEDKTASGGLSGGAQGESESASGDTNQEILNDVQTFCEGLQSHDKKQFENLLEVVCDKKQFLEMLEPGAGWDGKPESQENYMMILASTPPEDNKSDDTYYNKIFYALEVKDTHRTYEELIANEYSQPDVFKQKFELTPNVEIYPSQDGMKVADNVKSIKYRYRLKAMGLVFEFNSLMQIHKISDDFAVVMDAATDNFKGLKQRNHISLVKLHENASQSVLVLEERKVASIPSQVRDLAKTMLFKADKFKMGLIRSNLLK